MFRHLDPVIRQAAREPVTAPEAGRVDEHPSRPPIDVELGEAGPHRPHAVPLFRRRHVEGGHEGGARLLEVVGVDDQRLGQLTRRTGELAEDQYAALVLAGRDELFCDQIRVSSC